MKTTGRRPRNELGAVKSAVQRDHGVLFLQNQLQVRKLQAIVHGTEPLEKKDLLTEDNTPVWLLPKQ